MSKAVDCLLAVPLVVISTTVISSDGDYAKWRCYSWTKTHHPTCEWPSGRLRCKSNRLSLSCLSELPMHLQRWMEKQKHGKVNKLFERTATLKDNLGFSVWWCPFFAHVWYNELHNQLRDHDGGVIILSNDRRRVSVIVSGLLNMILYRSAASKVSILFNQMEWYSYVIHAVVVT
jgi:hypothetical protein